jgi:chemotaxis protein methyltransferase CheR
MRKADLLKQTHTNPAANTNGNHSSPSRSVMDVESRELKGFLEAVFARYGVDFRDYAYSSLRRRVLRQVIEEKAASIPDLQKLVLADTSAMERLLATLTIHATAMFRDPDFFKALRQEVLPVLRTYPFIRLWVAGCSTGEEVYSLAILLHEECLYSRCRIYATDLRESVLERARSGIFPLAMMRDYTRNYQLAGGQNAFAEYYTSDHESVVFRPYLRENVIFATHNLVGDSSFNEFHMIFCRNVMIYFNRSLQDRVHRLFYESLVTFGYLGLGRSETMRFSESENNYQAISTRERLYRKIK